MHATAILSAGCLAAWCKAPGTVTRIEHFYAFSDFYVLFSSKMRYTTYNNLKTEEKEKEVKSYERRKLHFL
ncbi:hypothetical protein C808_04608 [Lachnospiraceae bacterium M18-1]|nr:hypothetical protein C808_04608 [Lachnospiraceae bacterium M18-1]